MRKGGRGRLATSWLVWCGGRKRGMMDAIKRVWEMELLVVLVSVRCCCCCCCCCKKVEREG
jgi:hypothetical protein